ncbi:hypothetical protein XENORESO_012353 [Xenotaenia resolanae]|uniref:Uncharacterized protein n=1 Tax=Xenotaenia resolanae TaxID=208358 RepID=A0ABV0VR19_9TELE
MIPAKMLVYRGPDGDTHSKTVQNTTRRKKSTGELFQKGYRVRMGHGLVPDKEEQDSFCFSLGGCFHVISYWGKSTGGNFSEAAGWHVHSCLYRMCQLELVQDLAAYNAASLANANCKALAKAYGKSLYEDCLFMQIL